jgi:hypothetical protein
VAKDILGNADFIGRCIVSQPNLQTFLTGTENGKVSCQAGLSG